MTLNQSLIGKENKIYLNYRLSDVLKNTNENILKNILTDQSDHIKQKLEQFIKYEIFDSIRFCSPNPTRNLGKKADLSIKSSVNQTPDLTSLFLHMDTEVLTFSLNCSTTKLKT